MKLPVVQTVEVPKHREFVLLVPGTRITGVIIDTTKGTAKDLDEIPLLVDFQMVQGDVGADDKFGSLKINLGE